jgi:hypothetical protein
VDLAATFPGTCPASASSSIAAQVPNVSLSVGGSAVPIQGTRVPAVVAACGGSLSIYISPDAGLNPAFSDLNAAIELPSSVTPGQTAAYEITLSNTGTTAVSLSPCPVYTEYVGPSVTADDSYKLNCADASQIAAGASETYAMQVEVPAGTTGTDFRVEWALDGGPASGGTVGVSQ